jgi:hypothetical protein
MRIIKGTKAGGWREKILTRVGPGLFGGITFGTWLRLLREQNFAIDPSCLPRAVAITLQSLKNSAHGFMESRRFGPLLKDVEVSPPLFILGHFRAGTTHLHQLLAQDRRFAFPNMYQTSFPHTFLTTEQRDSPLLSFFLPPQRPMDNVEWTLASPQEDEFALCTATLRSPCLAWVFPRRRERFEKYLTFRRVAQTEIDQWRAAFELFLKKLSWKYQRPLVLKSPPHTGRIGLLLEMFPQARFVHIRREPYTVFQSSRRTFRMMLDWNGLQRPSQDGLDDWVLRQYREMYDAYFEQRTLISEGSLHEMSFEDLERDPMAALRGAYEALHLPAFEEVESDLRRYVDSLDGYRKNEFPELPKELKTRIAKEWSRCFEEWGYPR